MSKKKNVIARAGNFEITKESGSGHEYIRIKAIGGHWGVVHRDDSPMFGVWLAMCKDPEYRKGAEVRCVMEYMMSQTIYDEQFINDWWKSIEEYHNRRQAAAPEATEQEQQEAIDEVSMMEEAKELISED